MGTTIYWAIRHMQQAKQECRLRVKCWWLCRQVDLLAATAVMVVLEYRMSPVVSLARSIIGRFPQVCPDRAGDGIDSHRQGNWRSDRNVCFSRRSSLTDMFP